MQAKKRILQINYNPTLKPKPHKMLEQNPSSNHSHELVIEFSRRDLMQEREQG